MNHRPTDTAARRFIRCGIASFDFGLDLRDVRRIHGRVPLRPVNQPGPLLGWFTAAAAAEEIPVYDTAALFGLPKSESSSNGAVLAVSHGAAAATVGLSVDRVAQGSVSADGTLLPVPALLQAGAFHSVLVASGKPLLPVCDVNQLSLVCSANPQGGTGDSGPRTSAFGWPERPVSSSTKATNWRDANSRPAGKLLLSSPFTATTGDAAAATPVRLALSFTQVLEVLAEPEVLPLPGIASGYTGVLHWRGRLIPVLDPQSCFGLSLRCPAVNGRVLVVRNASGAGVLAIPAGADTGTTGLDQATAAAPQPQHVRFAFQSPTGLMWIPDVDALLTNRELVTNL